MGHLNDAHGSFRSVCAFLVLRLRGCASAKTITVGKLWLKRGFEQRVTANS